MLSGPQQADARREERKRLAAEREARERAHREREAATAGGRSTRPDDVYRLQASLLDLEPPTWRQ